MSQDLKPCPFCGGPAELWQALDGRPAWVACLGRCSVLVTRDHTTTEDAIAAWNRRADLHNTALAAAKAEGIREGMLKAAGLFEPDFEMTVIGMDADDMARVVRIIRAAAGEP